MTTKKLEIGKVYRYFDLFVLNVKDFDGREGAAILRAMQSLQPLYTMFGVIFKHTSFDTPSFELIPIFSENKVLDNLNMAADNLKRAAEIEERNVIRLKAIMDKESRENIETDNGDNISVLVQKIFWPQKPDEGAIAYRKAIRIAFDTNTPDNIAKQFADVLSDAKECADRAGQPVTIFAQFKVKPTGELAFDCPIEFQNSVRQFELAAILRDKFNVTRFRNKPVTALTKDALREALHLVRNGNTDLFKFKN